MRSYEIYATDDYLTHVVVKNDKGEYIREEEEDGNGSIDVTNYPSLNKLTDLSCVRSVILDAEVDVSVSLKTVLDWMYSGANYIFINGNFMVSFTDGETGVLNCEQVAKLKDAIKTTKCKVVINNAYWYDENHVHMPLKIE